MRHLSVIFQRLRTLPPGLPTALADALTRADADRELALHYLPEVIPQSRAVAGVEAVLLWQHPQLGLLQANEFLHSVEGSDLILPLTVSAVRMGCDQLVAWSADPERMRWWVTMSVNATEMERPEFADAVIAILSESAVDPGKLRIQVSERFPSRDTKSIETTVKRLRASGCPVGLDNFGDGHSSLPLIKMLEPDFVKISAKFASGVPGDRDSEELLCMLITLAKSFSMPATVKGIETEVQLGFCQAQGAAYCQGPLFGPPIVAAD